MYIVSKVWKAFVTHDFSSLKTQASLCITIILSIVSVLPVCIKMDVDGVAVLDFQLS